MPVINGTKGAYLQPRKYGRSSSGSYLEKTFVGTREQIASLIPILVGSSGDYDLEESFSGAADKLTVRFATEPTGGVEVPINDWEFFAGEIEKDILESDLSIINSISTLDKKTIRQYIQSPTRDDDEDVLGGPNDTPFKVYKLMLDGTRATRVLTPTLRHTQTVSNTYTIPAALTNVGRIIATSAMANLEGIPNDILFGLPDYSSARTGLVYGWYKKHPTVRTHVGQRTQIEQQWEYGLWPVMIYGALIT